MSDNLIVGQMVTYNFPLGTDGVNPYSYQPSTHERVGRVLAAYPCEDPSRKRVEFYLLIQVVAERVIGSSTWMTFKHYAHGPSMVTLPADYCTPSTATVAEPTDAEVSTGVFR